MHPEISPRLAHLLEAPLVGFLGTVRPDQTVQVNPMWFEFDGEVIRFSHTSRRSKYRNLQANPAMSLAVADPAHPEIYLEVRGRLIGAIPDPDGDFYVRLAQRYGEPDAEAPPDRADRVILVMGIEHSAPS